MSKIYSSGMKTEWHSVSVLGFVMDREDYVLRNKILINHPDVERVKGHLRAESDRKEEEGFSGSLRIIYSEYADGKLNKVDAIVPKPLEEGLLPLVGYPIYVTIRVSNFGGRELESFEI